VTLAKPYELGSKNPMLRETAEYPNSFVTLGPNDERIETDRYTLCMAEGKHWNTVQRQHFQAHELDEVLAEVRALLTERGRTRTQWEIGSAAEPAGLAQLLKDRGIKPDDEPSATAMALTTAPPAPPAELTARPVESLDEFIAANEVQWEAFGMPPEQIATERELAANRFAPTPSLMHAVWLDGEIVGAGTCSETPHGLALFGGATRPRARGRGVYRALIHARWQTAVQRGAPALLTQAGSMSQPILQKLGFTAIGRIEILLDDFGQ
jgi:GNAT superfamily N-acetyltransferase